MSRYSNVHSVQIVSDVTELEALANSMSPNSWAQFTSAIDQNLILRDPSGNTGSKLPYCNSMPWNPIEKRIEVSGQDHGSGSAGPQLKYFTASNSTWTLAGSIPGGAHGYNHSAVDVLTGDHYHVAYYNGGGNLINVRRKLHDSDTTWTLLPAVNRVGLEYAGIAVGACWWSGTLNLSGAGSAGNLFVYSPEGASTGSNRGNIAIFNPTSNSWFYNNGTGMAPGASPACYHTVAAYSTVKNVAVYGGGNNNTTRLWKFDASGNVTAMPTAPVPVGSHEIGQGRFCEEPVSGNFLAYYNGQLWRLNPDSTGSWTQLANPPSAITPGPNGSSAIQGKCLMCPIHEYGVVVVVTQTSQTNGLMHLYKHG
jgi:hypothetical protein